MKSTLPFFARPGTSYPPVTGVFQAMDERQRDDFFNWFQREIPYCIEELIQLVRHTPGYESWNDDDSVSSLDVLGLWLAENVEKRRLRPEEMKEVRDKSDPRFGIEDWVLTDESKSFCFFVGVYYGSVAIRNNATVRWIQSDGFFEGKKVADHGQPVLKGRGPLCINPIRVAHSIANRILGNEGDGRALRKAYEHWAARKGD